MSPRADCENDVALMQHCLVCCGLHFRRARALDTRNHHVDFSASRNASDSHAFKIGVLDEDVHSLHRLDSFALFGAIGFCFLLRVDAKNKPQCQQRKDDSEHAAGVRDRIRERGQRYFVGNRIAKRGESLLRRTKRWRVRRRARKQAERRDQINPQQFVCD